MNDKKDMLEKLVKNENVSSLEVMLAELGIPHDKTVALLHELIAEGRIHGRISEDEKRFWRSDVRVSEAPVIPRDDKLPAFLDYDTRPGKGLSIVGCLIDIIAIIILAYATDTAERDFGAIVFFVGLVLLLSGLYCVSRRDSPD